VPDLVLARQSLVSFWVVSSVLSTALASTSEMLVYWYNFVEAIFGIICSLNGTGPLTSTNKVKALIKLVVNFEIIPIPDGLTVVS
jgi:hypothetical protein